MSAAASAAVARRAFGDGRTRTLSFAALFGFVALIQPVAYRHSYPTQRDRLGLIRTFAENKAVRLFYGVPHDLLSVGGYTAWRLAGFACIFSALWGVLAAVRATRAEEDAGRAELVLSGVVTRRAMLLASLAAIAGGTLLLWAALFAGLVAGALPAGGSAYLALVTVSPIPVFVGVGVVAAQLAPTRRQALELANAVLVIALVLRVVADTEARLDWLRWVSPLGWTEELRPFADPQPAVLVLPLAAAAVLLAVAGAIGVRRDVGTGLLAPGDTHPPRLALLGSPTARALREERGTLLAWVAGIGFFALIIGVLTHSITTASIPANLRRQLAKVGITSVTTPSGALGFYFLFFVFAISLFACAQIAALRREEADQQLETLFALPVSRRSWLWGRLTLAACGAALLGLVAGLLSWLGTATQGGGVSLWNALGAGANCLPASLLFLDLGILAFAIRPRASAGIAYGLVSVAFVWELFGALLGVPSWLLGVSPFHQVGLVPAQAFKVTPAVVMVAIAVAAALAATRIFERRDLTGT